MPKEVKFSAFAMFYVVCIYLLSVKWLYKVFLILLSRDIEINPGPRRNTDENFFNLSLEPEQSPCLQLQ